MMRLSKVFLLLTLLLPCAARAQREPIEPEDAYHAALELYHERLLEPAIRAFSAFRAAYPDHILAPNALFYQAQATLEIGRSDEAAALLLAFQRAYPALPLIHQIRLTLGQYHFARGSYREAINTLRDVVAQSPPPSEGARALYWMGESALNLDQPDEAIGYFQQVVDTYPATTMAPAALYAIAVTEIKRERYDRAVRALEHLATRYPHSPYTRDIELALAEVYYELGDYSRAINEIQQRLPDLTGSNRERALFLLAESYNQLRDSENAIIYYRRFTEGNPDSPYYRRALYGLAWNYHFEGAYQWAAETFDQVRSGADDELAAEATYYAAVNRYLTARPREALALFQEVATRWPGHELADHALHEAGLIYYELREWAEANRMFGELIRSYPDSELLGEAYYQQGNTYIALGRFDEALQSFDQAVALDAAPASLKEEVVFQKAWLLYRSRHYEEAAPAFMELYESNPRGPKGDEALFWAAESFYQIGQVDRAIRLFQRYLQEYPGGRHLDAAHYALGWAYFKQNRYEEAIQSFERFLRYYQDDTGTVPYRTDALLRLADAYYALKRYPEAIRIYNQVAEEGEDYALYQIGQALSNAGDAFEAITTFRRLLVEYPESPYREEAQYNIAYLYFLNQDYDRAIEEYQHLIEAYPQDPLTPKAQYSIGDAYFNAGRLEEAIDAYRQVLLRYPNSPFAADAAAGIQYALVALNDEARAEEIIQAFIDEHPDSPVVDELKFRLAEAKFQSGKLEEARLAFLQFIRTTSNEALLPEAYFYLGSIFADRGDTSEAENYFRQLLERYPESRRRIDAARRLGELYLAQERFQEALRAYETLATEAARAGDGYLVAQARYGQSQALMQLGRAAEAERLLQEAIAAAPASPQVIPARLGLARIYEQTGRQREALDLYRTIAQQSKDEHGAEALVRLGELLLAQGNPSAAAEELGKLSVLFPAYTEWQARGYLIQAHAFLRLNQKGEAARIYDILINQFAGTPFAEQAAREKASL
ncbi:MAG: hypothetical protein KatS3mg044_1239 [Rhodothermaceae bacterium]|nr:MAG: hypothetical protein KatS3mg044_1239 [Rhodothermaceae bacterium]